MADVAFSRWDPLRDLLALHDQIGQLVGTDAPGWTPPVDLYENSGAFILTAELPGMSRDQIEIHVEGNRVVIRGERAGHEASCEQYHRVERGHGRFSRTFVLASPIDADAIAADLKDGLLTLTIPKANQVGRRVDVA
jgi:HSP20 family protein